MAVATGQCAIKTHPVLSEMDSDFELKNDFFVETKCYIM